MSRYEFSKQSYDALRDFLKTVEATTLPPPNANEMEMIEKLKQLIPVDTELIAKLTEAPNSTEDDSNTNSSSIKISQQHESADAALSDISDDTGAQPALDLTKSDLSATTATTQQDEELRNDLHHLMDIGDYYVVAQIFCEQTQRSHEWMTDLRTHPSIVQFGTYLVENSNDALIAIFCEATLSTLLSSCPDEFCELLCQLIENFPQFIYALLSKAIISLPEDTKITRELQDTFRNLPEHHKASVLGNIVNQTLELTPVQVITIDNLLFDNLDAALIRRLLVLLTRSENKCLAHRSCALLLQNLMSKCGSTLLQFKEHLRTLIDVLQGPIRNKLHRMLVVLNDKTVHR